jgi:exodeoxyribonuclease V beta subunit
VSERTSDLIQDAQPFDLTGPLPTGVTVLEASAGTGKTFTIAALATRFIAEGVPLEQLLLVSFTRMATGELRERVRERLLSSERALAGAIAGALPKTADDVDWLLASAPPAELELRRERLAHAIAGFDAATVETTHGFCMSVLEELGTLGDLDPDVEVVEHLDDLLEQVVDDLYVRRFFREQGVPPIDRSQAGLIARAAISHPDVVVYPLSAESTSVPAMRARLADAVKKEFEARKRALAVMSYDDMLTRLARTLFGSAGDQAVARLKARYRVVLIDEFQDTDPIQWRIVSRAFAGGDTTLVLIADPKQAIYAFRGADVYAYLTAARSATGRATLAVNRRSDERLLAGFDALLSDPAGTGVRLGHPEIVYRHVSATSAHHGSRLRGAPSEAALRIRVVDRREVAQTAKGWVSAPAGREHIARDVAADIVALLDSGAEIETRDAEGLVTGSTPVAPGDIAVLVPRHTTAAMVQHELEATAVPAVIAGAGSVFSTPSARDWQLLLEALERPSSSVRARSAALTPLLGWDAARLASADEDELEGLHQTLHGLSRVLAEQGVAALTESVMAGQRVVPRVLARAGGERRVTDLQHVAELLHRAAAEEQLGIAALTGWLRQRIEAAAREGAHGDERTRRLDSDAAAVQVLTIHRSKGLEFPVVYCPFLWEPGYIPEGEPVYFHDDGGTRGVDVALEGPAYDAHRARFVSEERGEDLRLAYVALTRARHQAVVWWAGSYTAGDSPLGRLLFARDAQGNVAASGRSTPSDADVFARLSELSGTDSVSVEWSRLGTPVAWAGAPAGDGSLAAARFERSLDTRWRRTSYTAITAAAHERLVGSEPEERGLVDEPEGPLLSAAGLVADASAAVPLATMGAGPEIGTVIHRALEEVEFDDTDLEGALSGAVVLVAGARDAAALLGCPVEAVADGLAAALRTPLGGAFGHLSLSSFSRGDRIDELGFELPLAGGEQPVARVSVVDLARLLRESLAEDDPLAAYADRLLDPAVAASGTLRGYLTGSIDLALRLPGRGADGAGDPSRPRYAILDYKTNWLGPPDAPLLAWHYRSEAVRAEMLRSHYALQALLYCVALHRYLRWRAPGYEASDLVSVHYLFLRGMLGSDAAVVDGAATGIFSWTPPPGLVVALSDLLDGTGGNFAEPSRADLRSMDVDGSL